MVGQLLGVLGEPVGIRRLDGFDDPGVQGATAVLKQAAVGHVVGEGVLEGQFRIREEARLVYKLRGLEPSEAAMKPFLRDLGDGPEEQEWYVLADHGRGLQKPLVLRRQPIDPRRQDCLDGRGDFDRRHVAGEPIRPALTDQRTRLD